MSCIGILSVQSTAASCAAASTCAARHAVQMPQPAHARRAVRHLLWQHRALQQLRRRGVACGAEAPNRRGQHIEAPRLVHAVLDRQARRQAVRGGGGGLPQAVVRRERPIIAPQLLQRRPRNVPFVDVS